LTFISATGLTTYCTSTAQVDGDCNNPTTQTAGIATGSSEEQIHVLSSALFGCCPDLRDDALRLSGSLNFGLAFPPFFL
jgi:hypothetical protein